MIKILSGEMAIELHLQFLIRNNNTDLMILKNTKVGNSSDNGSFLLVFLSLLNINTNTYFLLNTSLHFILIKKITFKKNNKGRNP